VRLDIITIFPDYLSPLSLSLVGKAQATGLLDTHVHDLREWTTDRHRSVDDTPYGGGPGMVMKPEPWGAALEHVFGEGPAGIRPRLVVPTPAGRLFTQSIVAEFASLPWLVFACGRYEGIDARVIDWASTHADVDEISLGDYVVSGGESAVLVIVEAVVRLLPGVVGNPESLTEESHVAGLLEYPAFTKPPIWDGRAVPEVLLSGDHARIARWRRDQALRRTAARRPDLLRELDPARFDDQDHRLLRELGWLPGEDGRLRRAR
jgi:tRNA (guanine37-N1)-methyltransferase